MRESALEQKLTRLATSMGWVAIKVGHSGWPDKVFLREGGVAVWVEFKRRGGRARMLQDVRIQSLHRLGQVAGVADDVKSFLDLLQRTF